MEMDRFLEFESLIKGLPSIPRQMYPSISIGGLARPKVAALIHHKPLHKERAMQLGRLFHAKVSARKVLTEYRKTIRRARYVEQATHGATVGLPDRSGHCPVDLVTT